MKQVVILGGLLAASLVGAYVTWTAPEAEEPAGDVLVLRATADELKAVTWKEADKTVRLTRTSDANGPYFVVETVEQKKVLEPPAPTELASNDPALATDAPPAPEPKVEEVKSTFTGGADAEKIWKAFAPFYALRELTAVAPDDLATYGLAEPGVTLELDVGGRTTTVELGGEAFGTRDRYARIDGKLYLLDDEALRSLQLATTKLVERRVHPLDEADITEVTVSKGDAKRTFVQKNGADKARAFWADLGRPDERDVEGSTWLGKLLKARIRAYEPQPDVATLSPIFTFDVKGKDGKRWSIEILKGEKDGQTEYYARSSWTRTVAELTRSLVEGAVADVDNLFDGVAAPAEDDAPAKPAATVAPPSAPAPSEPTATPVDPP